MTNDPPNRILEFLTAKAKPAGDACRTNRRRRSSARVELTWDDGKGWRSIPGRLKDIGRGGACLVVRKAPQEARQARLRIVLGEGTPWIEGQILDVQVEVDAPGRHRIRLRFEDPCPSFVLHLAVVDGVEPGDEIPTDASGWATCGAIDRD